MAKLIIVLAALVAVCAANDFEEWTKFKNRFNKQYTAAEELSRFVIFQSNLRKVELHNAQADQGFHGHRVAINRFSDMTVSERRQFSGYRANGQRPQPTGHFRPSNAALPSTVDWRNSSLVTPVKDQGGCGSCWAFSAVASIEGQHAKATGNLISLSEQNLVDCSGPEGNDGCDGGLMDQAFQYVIDNGGLDTEKSYPYEGEDDNCQYNKKTSGATVTGFTDIPTGDEDSLQQAVATIGPVSVAVDASGFFDYESGIYTDSSSCGNQQQDLDHGVTAVGYGTENGQDYWLIKNSWGDSWGEQGYIRLARNAGNLCGVATDASYPLV